MGYKILVVDDEKVNLALISAMLENFGNNYQALQAERGDVALDIARKEDPDLILLDWEMPGLSGIDVLKQLKSNFKTRDIPVIMETGLASSLNLEEALEAGAIDYIRKPIDRVELLARVKSALMLYDSIKEIKFQKQRIEEHVDELNKLSLIIRQTDNSVIIFNPDGEIEWANEGFTKMYGYTLDEFIYKFGSNIASASYDRNIQEKIRLLFATRQSVSYVNKCRVKYGATKWIQTTLTPVFDGHQIEKFIAIEIDISQQKMAELQLRRTNEQMKKLIEDLQKANKRIEEQKRIIDEEQKRTEKLLSNILPHHVAAQLKTTGYAKPRNYRRATVMFTDFKGFTKSCEHLSPDEIVSTLHSFFTAFDDIISTHYIEKIKTIGDAYMCVGGVPVRNRSNPFDVVIAGLEIQHFMSNLDVFDPEKKLPRWDLRVGIHTGPLTAGVVGKIKFAYDIWGDTVNIAKRMESADEIGKVNISGSTYEYIKDYFECTYRGKIEIKNRGKIDMYFVEGLKPEYTDDVNRIVPNKKFIEILNSL